MAFVADFEKLNDAPGRGRHPTEVTCRWGTIGSGQAAILQLNTYGSSHRDMPDKLSQTLQFDAAGAERLLAIIEAAFPGLRSARS